MKRASTLVTAMIAIAVLLTALVVGLAVKQLRMHWAASKPGVVSDVGRVGQSAGGELPAGPVGPGTARLGPDARGAREDGRGGMRGRRQRMPEEERWRFTEERPRMFDAGRWPDRPGARLSEEERQRLRARFENMTEEERQRFREEMRRRFGAGRRGGGAGERGFAPVPPAGGPERPPDANSGTKDPEGIRED